MSKTYTIKEMFMTLQGEGVHTGRLALFVRFTGCNLWTGRPEDRSKGSGACSLWCDTAFVGGKKYSLKLLVEEMNKLWPGSPTADNKRFVVFTGGEPFLQLDRVLIEAVQGSGWSVAVESNGTIPEASYWLVDHLTISPKMGASVCATGASELKVVLPGHENFDQGWTNEQLEQLKQSGSWSALYVQPQDPIVRNLVDVTYLKSKRSDMSNLFEAEFEKNLARCLSFIEMHPEWKLSLQTHKFIKLP
jgi:organic radical activating enzyme